MSYLCTTFVWIRSFKRPFSSFFCPDGGIGRRAGLKHQCRKASRFEPESGYFCYITIIAKALHTKTLAIFLFPTCSIFAPFQLDKSRFITVRHWSIPFISIRFGLSLYFPDCFVVKLGGSCYLCTQNGLIWKSLISHKNIYKL